KQDGNAPSLRSWWSEVRLNELLAGPDPAAWSMRRKQGESMRDYKNVTWGEKAGVVLQEMRCVSSFQIPTEAGSVEEGGSFDAGRCLVVHLRFPPGQGP